MIEKSQICVVLPAHNEEKSIRIVSQKILILGYTLCVVDDGSTDQTLKSIEGLSLKIISLGTNHGKGYALRKGLDWAYEQNFKAAILMDADGQHDPGEIDSFIQALNDQNADLVIGNRMENSQSMPLVRLGTNRLMSWLISVLAGQKISDCTCGFRALRLEAFKRMALRTDRYEIEPEMVFEAARLKLKIASVPTACIYAQEISQIRPVRDTGRFIKFIVHYIFKRRSRI